MATQTAGAAASNAAGKPKSPVPLDTIPISPPPGNPTGDENVDPKKEGQQLEQITVFHDAENFNVKHPLMHNWTLWFTKPPSGKVRLAFR
jgi:translation initiation factor 4E